MSDNRRFFFTIVTIAFCTVGARALLKRLEAPLQRVVATVVLDDDTVAAWRFVGI